MVGASCKQAGGRDSDDESYLYPQMVCHGYKCTLL